MRIAHPACAFASFFERNIARKSSIFAVIYARCSAPCPLRSWALECLEASSNPFGKSWNHQLRRMRRGLATSRVASRELQSVRVDLIELRQVSSCVAQTLWINTHNRSRNMSSTTSLSSHRRRKCSDCGLAVLPSYSSKSSAPSLLTSQSSRLM